MRHELTHASFFSGVGGLDMGLERAGWRTVSFSEIDPYASAVLAERWPGVPNLGDIVSLAGDGHSGEPRSSRVQQPEGGRLGHAASATLWTGGFPCQDLSVAGKRRGMGTDDDRTRSGLAYAFLDLVEQHRPPAILLENVPGLRSSNGGKDLGALLGRLGELGYWWAYRILDAQFFGVPQRRRRVFICALHAGAGFGADSAAAVLSVGARCGGHSAAGDEAGEGVARRPAPSTNRPGWGRISHALSAPRTTGRNDPKSQAVASGHVIADGQHRPSPDAGRVREVDGLAGRPHHSEVVGTLRVGAQRPQDGGPGDTVPIIVNALDQRRGGADDNEAQSGQLIADGGPFRPATERDAAGPDADSLLPLGLDSHRYRCCGNGVVSNVSEWIGVRLARAVQSVGERAA